MKKCVVLFVAALALSACAPEPLVIEPLQGWSSSIPVDPESETDSPADQVGDVADEAIGELAFADDPMCADMSRVIGELYIRNEPTAAFAQHLPAEFSNLYSGSSVLPNDVANTEDVQRLVALDEYTTEQCGFPYVAGSFHTALTCLPPVPAGTPPLPEAITALGDCVDIREQPEAVGTFIEMIPTLRALGATVQSTFTEIPMD